MFGHCIGHCMRHPARYEPRVQADRIVVRGYSSQLVLRCPPVHARSRRHSRAAGWSAAARSRSYEPRCPLPISSTAP